MDNIKLSLSVLLPGSTMFSTAEVVKPLKKQFKTKKGKSFYKTVLVPDIDKHDAFTIKVTEGKKEIPLTVFIRKTKAARQVINMSEDAYNYFISKEVPIGFQGGSSAWNKLTTIQKVRWHCNRIAQNMNGWVESFQVME